MVPPRRTSGQGTTSKKRPTRGRSGAARRPSALSRAWCLDPAADVSAPSRRRPIPEQQRAAPDRRRALQRLVGALYGATASNIWSGHHVEEAPDPGAVGRCPAAFGLDSGHGALTRRQTFPRPSPRRRSPRNRGQRRTAGGRCNDWLGHFIAPPRRTSVRGTTLTKRPTRGRSGAARRPSALTPGMVPRPGGSRFRAPSQRCAISAQPSDAADLGVVGPCPAACRPCPRARRLDPAPLCPMRNRPDLAVRAACSPGTGRGRPAPRTGSRGRHCPAAPHEALSGIATKRCSP